MKFFFLILFCVSAFAQEQYELKGSLGINPETKKNIEFVMNWNEANGKLIGSYQDNYYSDKVAVKGISGGLGRIFVVTLPRETKGVRTISFLGSDLRGKTGSAVIPFSVVLRDDKGTPVKTIAVDTNLTGLSQTVVAQKQEDPSCSDGFGAMAGYCGVYGGMITEEEDSAKKCDLLSFNNTKLVLDNNAELGLSLGEVSELVSSPVHRIGRLITDPSNTNVDLMSRACRPLPGVTFKGDNCKRLSIIGSFSIIKNNKHFAGSYTITDENTNQSCRYSLSMDQQM